ncbi:hypothetical protein [uncultured Clostridium sp.]|uniref:hypothetical protein n=1 Tax=uncultured Clostridium sp. TaxID=59620 RepID=UPI0025826B3B|nr:hypothetical protein [uncultured Clostridium sp.]MDU1350325.1 hypothetical protein [Clostridium argentinense]
MNKQEIINLVDEITGINNFSHIIHDGEKKDEKRIGISQFRDIANICKECECCEEIKLLIQYKTAKGNGWNNKIPHKDRGRKFGDIVLQYIEKIERSFDRDENLTIDAVSKFFGYLFWKATVVKSKQKEC